jgi:hypothetical protein
MTRLIKLRVPTKHVSDTKWVAENGQTSIEQLISPKEMKIDLPKSPGLDLEKRISLQQLLKKKDS